MVASGNSYTTVTGDFSIFVIIYEERMLLMLMCSYIRSSAERSNQMFAWAICSKV